MLEPRASKLRLSAPIEKASASMRSISGVEAKSVDAAAAKFDVVEKCVGVDAQALRRR
jgi:hypothetical protein